MSIRRILENNFPYTDPVVSNEGLIDSIRKVMGKSNKGKEGALKENDKHVYDVLQLIGKHYANASWTKKQTYIQGEVPAKGIVEFIGKDTSNLPTLLQRTQSEMVGYFSLWYRSLSSNQMNYLGIAPMVAKHDISKLKEIKERIDKTPGVDKHYKLPDTFKAVNRKVGEVPKAVGDDLKIPALNQAEVLAVGKMLASMVESYFDNDTKCYMEAVSLWDTMKGDVLEVKASKDDSLKPLFNAIKHLKPADVNYSNKSLEAIKDVYSETIIAVCRWLDRSIK